MRLFPWAKGKTQRQSDKVPKPFSFSGIGTLLVSDVSGFSIANGFDSESLARLMNDCFTSIAQIIQGEQGRVFSSTGDSTVAIWDSSHTTPSHSEMAMACGRKLLETRSGSNSNGSARYTLHVFIATGKITVGIIGDRPQVVGEPWAIVKKMEAFVRPGKSQMLYTSQTSRQFSSPSAQVGQITGASGDVLPVFEFTVPA
jgi:class 3 adenylate cyclase